MSAEEKVDKRYSDICSNEEKHYVFSQGKVNKYIKKLKKGCAPGRDGVMAEHLKYSMETSLPEHLSRVFTLCVRYGIVPKSFNAGILVPILKKANIDPSIPKNYRPVIISTMFSKLMEMCAPHAFHDLQFGFIETRGTHMAICIAHDTINYCNTRGSAVYTCALDAEMAFDGIPHSILLEKAMNVIPDMWWRLLYTWYKELYVNVKWNRQMSDEVKIEKGTRQGGLTSPFLFNLFYQDMVDDLSETVGGIKVNGKSYNVFVYADDLLLVSLTVTGLQTLIQRANKYITDHGLSFNASKTSCVTFGKCHLEPSPVWKLNETQLAQDNELDYLGAVLSNDNHTHQQKRLKSCRQGFFGLQGAGMCSNGVKPEVAAHLWKAILQPVLLYACHALPIRKTDIAEMDRIQAKLIKTSLGLSKFMRTTPLINALQINRVPTLINVYSMDMIKSIMFSNTSAKSFYSHIFKSKCFTGKYKNLISRVNTVCNENRLSFTKFLFNDDYFKMSRAQLKKMPVNDGITVCCQTLLKNYNACDKEMLKLLLMPF